MNFEDFIKDYTILDSELININIYNKNSVLKIDLIVRLKVNIYVKFNFSNIIEYNFYYSNKNIFYTISDYIFEKDQDIFYISLDPYNGSNGISEDDMDFIKSGSLSIEFLETIN